MECQCQFRGLRTPLQSSCQLSRSLHHCTRCVSITEPWQCLSKHQPRCSPPLFWKRNRSFRSTRRCLADQPMSQRSHRLRMRTLSKEYSALFPKVLNEIALSLGNITSNPPTFPSIQVGPLVNITVTVGGDHSFSAPVFASLFLYQVLTTTCVSS